MSATLLIADDDPVARDLLAEVLTREGYQVATVPSGEDCVRRVETEPFDLLLVDLRMPDLDGLQVLKRLRGRQPELPIVILTAFASIDTAIEAIRAGASDYLSKPFRMEEIALVVRRTLDAQRLTQENRYYRQQLRQQYGPETLVGHSALMVEVYKLVARVANLDSTVLIHGETGTGKELIARAIHHASARADRPFVAVDCAALPEALFESELFGHERGAFTGAVAVRRGLLETADGGTCFLDEVADLSPTLQAKLLRSLQERAVRRVGGNAVVPVDVRILAATNRDLERQVQAGAFREDLYYRLSTITVTIPPLRDRPEDILPLAQHFIERYRHTATHPISGLAPDTVKRLLDYSWPGNVRQLEHAVERALAFASSEVLKPEDFSPPLQTEAEQRAPRLPARRMTLEELKRWYVATLVEEFGGNKLRAAEVLGIDRRTLYRILERRGGEDDTESETPRPSDADERSSRPRTGEPPRVRDEAQP